MPDRRNTHNGSRTGKPHDHPPPSRPNKPADPMVNEGPAMRPRARYVANPPRRHDRPHGSGTSPTKQASTSVKELRSKIRDTKRLLKRVDKLPADVRVEKERAIVEYERELARIEGKGPSRTAAESKRIKKYHFVRFMEQKHAERLINRIDRQRATLKEQHASPEELADVEAQLQVAHVDLNYARYSPLMQKYVSLYPKDHKSNGKRKRPEEGDASNILRGKAGEKPSVWYVVQQCMEEGTLNSLRNGKVAHLCKGKIGIAKRDGDGEGDETTGTLDPLPVLETGKASSSSIVPVGNTLGGNDFSGHNMKMSDDEDKNDGRAFFDI